MSREEDNVTEASMESAIMRLAVLDFQQVPSLRIKEILGKEYRTLCTYRASDLYKATLEELKTEWKQEMFKLPQTLELRKKVQHAMVLGLNAVIDILSGPKSSAKDKIAAARLASQWDGRFLTKDGDDDPEVTRNQETIAQELLSALERHKTTVN